MKQTKNELVTGLLVSLFLIILPFAGMAQTGPPDPNDVPVDGGIGFLLAAGAGYGVKKLRQARNRRKA